MSNHMTLAQWLENYAAGQYANPSVNTQIEAGWWDWFCSNQSLANRLKKLAPKVKKIAKSEKIDVNATYVFFKNNCPIQGPTYDDFRICDLETEDVIFTVVPKWYDPRINTYVSEVWGKENDFEKALVQGTWKEVLQFFGV